MTIALTPAQAQKSYDIVIYGDTPAGITAAIQGKQMGHSVAWVQPSAQIGGLTASGLGWTDSGKAHTIGGLSRNFYERIRAHYQDPKHWNWRPQEHLESLHPRIKKKHIQEDAMFIFEPKVASKVFQEMLSEVDIDLILQARIRRPQGTEKEGTEIQALILEDGTKIHGRRFIDATYEGDLFAEAGISFAVGREACSQYNEVANGVQTVATVKHQFDAEAKVSPYIIADDPKSGLLPSIDPKGPGIEKEGDHRIQAYNFRMCLTNVPENRITIEKPENYDPLEYELLLRYIESGTYHPAANKYDPIPNGKTDTNNHGAVSTDYIGRNYEYPEGSYQKREEIVQLHKDFQIGYLWTLQNHPRVPEDLKTYYRQWGLPKDEFQEFGNWPPLLYIREARRLVGQEVMTEHHCTNKAEVPDPVGIGSYQMDSHNVQRYVTKEGYVRNEGDIQHRSGAYGIGYRTLLPKKDQCTNLIVPVCISSSHIAYGSIRMEPVYMILGQSAATACSLSLEAESSLHDVPYPALAEELLKLGQILDPTISPKRPRKQKQAK